MKLTKPDVPPNPDHPAKFSEPILVQLRAVMEAEAARLARAPMVLDPFAGTGRIHQLRPLCHTVGVEVEPEWAACHPDTWVGDALDLPAQWTNHFDVTATSWVYPNRLTDHHNAKDPCNHTIKRTGQEPRVYPQAGCPKCKGGGLSPRKSYKSSLNRMPTEGSSSVMRWGDGWRDFHRKALVEMIRVTDDGGLLVVNTSNHYQGVKTVEGTRSMLMRVVEWTIEAMLARGLYVEAVLPVATSRMRHGANYRLRAGVEHIIVMRKPVKLVDDAP